MRWQRGCLSAPKRSGTDELSIEAKRSKLSTYVVWVLIEEDFVQIRLNPSAYESRFLINKIEGSKAPTFLLDEENFYHRTQIWNNINDAVRTKPKKKPNKKAQVCIDNDASSSFHVGEYQLQFEWVPCTTKPDRSN